jgi:hypothetical protein
VALPQLLGELPLVVPLPVHLLRRKRKKRVCLTEVEILADYCC